MLPEGAVGLMLSDKSMIKRHDPQWYDGKRDCAISNGDQCLLEVSNPTHKEVVDGFTSKVRIVFIGACYISDTFLNMWDITSATPDRALIVPVSTPTSLIDLYFSAIAWENISIKLSESDTVTVADAVAYANGQLAASHYRNGAPVTLRFHVIGGNEGHNVTKKR